MAWMELLRSMDFDPEMVREMNKDVDRLSTIASRFSKIGSQPQMETDNVNTVVGHAASYMATRISSRITLSTLTLPRTAQRAAQRTAVRVGDGKSHQKRR